MTRQTEFISIGIMFCILSLFCISICFAQDTYGAPSDSVTADCASLVTSGQNAEAFGCFGHAIEADPSSAFDWAGQGDVMNNIGYYHQALIYYEKAISLDPYSANILTSKGRTLTRLGRYEDAMTCFNLALNLRPNNAYTWKSIGDLYTEQHDTTRAEAAYSKAKLGDHPQPAVDVEGVEKVGSYISHNEGI